MKVVQLSYTSGPAKSAQEQSGEVVLELLNRLVNELVVADNAR